MQHDLVISGGTVATASETFSADIGIRDGRIVTLGEELKGRDEINAAGKLVLPGGIETHLEEPPESGPPTGIQISLVQEDPRIGGKREKPEDIVLKLRQVEVWVKLQAT